MLNVNHGFYVFKVGSAIEAGSLVARGGTHRQDSHTLVKQGMQIFKILPESMGHPISKDAQLVCCIMLTQHKKNLVHYNCQGSFFMTKWMSVPH